MNTAALKRFAQQARVILKDGIQTRLNYWGFDRKGNVTDEPISVEGGVIFRGEGIDDPTLFKKWDALRTAICTHGFEHIAEEAAYTWFNRLMAIRILAKNGYIRPQLEFESNQIQVPLIVSNARRGQYPTLTAEEKKQLNELLKDDSAETEQFALLITVFCRKNKLLSRVFGRMNDYTELLLPRNILSGNGFIALLNSNDFISDDDYRQVELIGWLYQFYISEKKDEVFKSFKNKKKAEAEDIPAATQIFTPNWIVKYMVQNTVGRLWLDLNPDSELKSEMNYLVKNPDAKAVKSEPLVAEVSEIKLLDPACGSGHILVEGFDLLFDMYTEEGYSKREAVREIFYKNLYGLDIDIRAAQLANFALLLKAAAKDTSVLEDDIMPQVYAMPEPYAFSENSIRVFLGEETQYAETLQKILDLMQQAQNLGSVMKIAISPEMRQWLQTQLAYWKKRQAPDMFIKDDFEYLSPYIRIILLLTQQYEAVAANPPYMGSGNMNEELKVYVNKNYPNSKSDLMTIFMDVISYLTLSKGRYGMVNLPSWLFLSSFQKLREDIVKNQYIESLLHFGRGIFGIDFGSVAFAIKKENFDNRKGSYFRLHERNFQHIYYQDIEKLFLYAKNDSNYKYDFSLYRDDDGVNQIPSKSIETGLRLSFPNISQSQFEKIPGSPIAYWVSERIIQLFSNKWIIDIYQPATGLQTGDNNKYVRQWTEVSYKLKHLKWIPLVNGGSARKWYGNLNDFILWENNGCEIKLNLSSVIRNEQYYFSEGATWNRIASNGFSLRYFPQNCIFDQAGDSLFSKNENALLPVIAYLNSNVAYEFIKIIAPTLNMTAGNIGVLPFINSCNVKIEQRAKQNISISRLDWDSRETSWDFQQNELIRQQKATIKAAYEEYLRYCSQQFAHLHSNEVELNRIFIDIYGLQEELTPEVKLRDITILQDELDYSALGEKIEMEELSDPQHLPLKTDEVIKQFISYSVGCMMGRYRLDRSGLHIAHPNPSEEEIASYEYNGKTFTIDDDGIIPLMDASCSFGDNALLRLKAFIRQVWGHETEIENINFIESALGKDLEIYLVKDFWKDHCRRYQKRPIYWLFSSPKGAFQVITYMHRMNKYTAEKIRSNYLLRHIQNLESRREIMEAESATLDRTGQRTLDKVIKDLIECREYDLYLKDIADQQIEFDLDDGVVVNYAKFGDVLANIK